MFLLEFTLKIQHWSYSTVDIYLIIVFWSDICLPSVFAFRDIYGVKESAHIKSAPSLFPVSTNLSYCFFKELTLALYYIIFKKGIRRDPLNYRPVSLMSVCVKSLECILYEIIFYCSASNDILCNEQFGLHPGSSTEDQLLLTYSDISYAMDQGNNINLILFLLFFGLQHCRSCQFTR